jgi:hypothetical protein
MRMRWPRGCSKKWFALSPAATAECRLDGVPLTNPWTFSGGVMTMSFGGGQYTDGDGLASDTTDLGRRVMVRFSSALTTMLPTI